MFSHVCDPELSSVLQRFLRKIDDYSDYTKCWIWVGTRKWDGYGSFSFRSKTWRAHRWAYWLKYGKLTPGLQLHHECKNKSCVNPLHLIEVSQSTNMLQGELWNHNSNKTHCKHGHAYDEANTLYSIEQERVRRHCRACDRIRWHNRSRREVKH